MSQDIEMNNNEDFLFSPDYSGIPSDNMNWQQMQGTGFSYFEEAETSELTLFSVPPPIDKDPVPISGSVLVLVFLSCLYGMFKMRRILQFKKK